MKIKIKKRLKDWDFKVDLAKYEGDDIGEEQIESILQKRRPAITGLRSRFSNGQAELEQLAELLLEIRKIGIKVAARTQDITVLWNYYGALTEFWEGIRNIYGSQVNDEIDSLNKRCLTVLKEAESKGGVSEKVNNELLRYRSHLYRLKQLSNLGIEVEKVSRGGFSKAKRQITE